MRITVDTDKKELIYAEGTPQEKVYPLYEADALKALTHIWVKASWNCKYSYDFEWLGRRIIQMPDDIVRQQELIWAVKPDVIVETGVAHGGSTVFYAGMMELMGRGKVISIDIEIRKQNRDAIEAHPLFPRITLIERSSIDPKTLKEVKKLIPPGSKVMVFLDSNHTKTHVAGELEMYSPLVTPSSYIVAADGVMSILYDVPRGKPEWAYDNPLEAAREFLQNHPEFELDSTYTRSGVTHIHGGYLRRKP